MNPIDAALDMAEATVSLGVREMICRLNGDSASFTKTAANLQRTAQLSISHESVRHLVETEGKRVVRDRDAGRLPIGWTAADCATADGPRRVYLGSDGVTVPTVTEKEKENRRGKIREKRRTQGIENRPAPLPKAGTDEAYKEAKIVTFYDEDQNHRHAVATRHNHEEAGAIMRREAERIDFDTAEEKVANVDGADWIRNQMRKQEIALDGLGLDFYHLSEQAHKARRAVYGEDNSQGRTWISSLLHTAKHAGYQALWNLLTEWRGQLPRSRRKAADALLHYVAKRQEMIAYPRFLELGWQIGSGPTEGLAKTTTGRIKGRGRKWDPENSEAIMALTCLEQSNQWQGYWDAELPQ
jgi:hypothetical protein